jgi:SAM-dependent methyltransferase
MKKISTFLTRYFMYNHLNKILSEQPTLDGDILGISGLGAINSMLPKTNKRQNISYPNYDVTNLKLNTNKYDYVICDQVLEHVENPFLAISEMNRVLKPNGLLILTTCFMNFYHKYPIDYWRFSPDALAYLCQKFSKIIDVGGWGNVDALKLILDGHRYDLVEPDTEMENIALQNDNTNFIVTWIIAQK